MMHLTHLTSKQVDLYRPFTEHHTLTSINTSHYPLMHAVPLYDAPNTSSLSTLVNISTSTPSFCLSLSCILHGIIGVPKGTFRGLGGGSGGGSSSGGSGGGGEGDDKGRVTQGVAGTATATGAGAGRKGDRANKDSLQAIASGGGGGSSAGNGVKFSSSSSSSSSSSHREEGATGYGSRGKPRSSTSSSSQGQGLGQGHGHSSSFMDAARIDALLYPPGDDGDHEEGRDGVVSGYDNSGNDDVSSGGNEDDRCFVCNEGMGKLLLCDFPGCPRAYHQICVLTTFPVPLGGEEVGGGGGGGDDDSSSAVWFCPRHQCVCCDALQLNPEPEYEPEYMYQNSSSSDSAATATAASSSRGGGGRSGRANSGSSGSGDVRYVAVPPAKPPQPLSLYALQVTTL